MKIYLVLGLAALALGNLSANGRAGVDVQVGPDDGYYDDGYYDGGGAGVGIWVGPGYYNGVWFDDEDGYRNHHGDGHHDGGDGHHGGGGGGGHHH